MFKAVQCRNISFGHAFTSIYIAAICKSIKQTIAGEYQSNEIM